ncbi:MAG: sensor histidine kinase KdpD [Verrucomicrobiota bacterium]
MTEDDRPDPDQLLAEHWHGESPSRAGRLVLFLGMCPGVGKTYAMLKAAHQRRQEGVSVVAGIVETHGRAETAVLLEELEEIPRLHREHRGHRIGEFDLDAVLRRRPQLVLVDELAHTNAPGSRHAKRYQDVQELLAAGIDVYTTLNVQHIESQVDTVRQITGVTITETVPDSILDQAQEIQLIDLRVPQLLERLAEGRVYQGERAAQAAEGFFKEANLTALRELALRFTAEHVDRDLEEMRRRRRVSSPWKTSARLMVGVGPSPYSESLVRWTRRAATRLGCPWLVVWVESSRALTPEEQARLTGTLGLARRLGAEVISVTDESVSAALLRTARERNVTQIVVGKPGRFRWWRASLADLLIRDSGDIDICVVRPLISGSPARAESNLKAGETITETGVAEYSSALAAGFVLVSLAWGMAGWLGYMAVGLLFLLGVILASLRLSRGPVLLMAAGLALSWDFLFIEPKFTFHISQVHDVIMFVMFFIVAFSMGHLTTRLRQREKAERQRQRHTAALLRVTQSAALSADPAKGLAEALGTIGEMLHAGTALVVRGQDRSLPETLHRASSITPSPKEWGVIHWVYQNRQAAGRFTGTLPESAATWFPLETATALLGVFGVQLGGRSVMDFGMRQAIEAFALQLALVLEKEHFIQAVKHADLLAHSEQLQRTLLDSVSHELKTPLAVIQASLEGLADADGVRDVNADGYGDQTGPGTADLRVEKLKQKGTEIEAGKREGAENFYLGEIKTASRRLQRVVNNLLQMTRIESAAVRPQREWCLVGDLVQQSLGMVGDALAGRVVTVNIPSSLPAVEVDSGILSQVMANILHNAAVYTPAGTGVEITAVLRDLDENNTHGRDARAPVSGQLRGMLELRIADHGPGIPEADLARVFEKFHRLPGSPTGGTGLGLSIAQAFVRALGGTISAGNRAGGGAEFTILLPVDVLPA